ncbi:hypothetical protein LguiB_023220 [Lonicera macranthoides]
MAWFSGNISLGNFADIAGAVNSKISESVKNIEKNFDNALGFEEKSDAASTEESGLWPSATDRKALFEPVMTFMGRKEEESSVESSDKPESSKPSFSFDEKEAVETHNPASSANEQTPPSEEANDETAKVEVDVHPEPVVEMNVADAEGANKVTADPGDAEGDAKVALTELSEANVEHVEESDSSNHLQPKESGNSGSLETESINPADQIDSNAPILDQLNNITESDASNHLQQKEILKIGSLGDSGLLGPESVNPVDQANTNAPEPDELHDIVDQDSTDEHKQHGEEVLEKASLVKDDYVTSDGQSGSGTEPPDPNSPMSNDEYSKDDLPVVQHLDEALETVPELVSHEDDAIASTVEVNRRTRDYETDVKGRLSSGSHSFDNADSIDELEKVKREMKMMENALLGAARQAQAKADEIGKLMNENEQLKAVIEDTRRKSSEAEIESLREEYHQRVSALERKVYALTRERDTLRREQTKKSDAAALLKEKDEIINQVMAEGEELSKKQAAQESKIRKLRAQIREFEEEKKGLITKLQVEENKVESIKRDKAATENLLQETIEKHQTELATQKEYYTNALNAAKEAEALAEARVNNEARTELESCLREAEDREAMLVQALEELRQTLSRMEQQAVFREDMLHRDIEDLQKRYQASERRCEELVMQVPESTRPLLRQIEAMQETNARRAEAWAAVERSLNSRLQEAETKAATAEERERSVNERLTQTLSRINVLEAQISCLRAEQTQITRSLEKERQRAAENRQEYLALKEEADTHEGRVNQLEDEIRELKRKHKQELQEALAHRELLQQEIEQEKAARLEMERTARAQSSAVSEQNSLTKHRATLENANLSRRLSSASSLSSMEESYFLQASLDSSDNFSEWRNPGETTMSTYYMKSMTPNAFEAALRQKEGELASYMSRLASMESIRDSLAEELVKMTAQCEKLRAEASMLPGIRAELESLRRRHSSALELMGERDEELEELRADIVDLKEMYREQVNLLVNKIQVMNPSAAAAF